MIRKLSLLVLALVLLPMLAFAQTGKLTGRITDGDTGVGLPGATVFIEGTSLGAASDPDGNYVVIGVPVGTHSVRVSFVGYAPETRKDVVFNSGYTRELDFQLFQGVELDEVVVTYVRPLIQKDATGVPKIVTAEEIVTLPVRGVADLAKIQAGVTSKDGSSTLNIRGGRGSEVTYYIDGVKVAGSIGLPQSAIEEQEMLIGNISARYGDVMSGVINITTKSGRQDFFGSFEAITSQQLDPYGYNLLSGTVGGPIYKDKVSFFLAGEYQDDKDTNPRATTELFAPDNLLNDLRAMPQAFRALDMDGNAAFIPIPGSLSDGAMMTVDDDGNPDVADGQLTFSDGTTIAIPGNVDPLSISFSSLENRANFLTEDDFSWEKDKRKREYQNLSLTGNVNWNVFGDARLRLGGRLNKGEWDTGQSNRRIVFAPEMTPYHERDEYQVYAQWTQNLSNTTFFQIQADYHNSERETYDPRFGTSESDFIEYGNIDNPVFGTLSSYKDFGFTTVTRTDDHGTADTSDDTTFDVEVPTYTRTYTDGQGPSTSDQVIANLMQQPGGRFNGYSKAHDTQFRVSGSATTQVGLHQVEFGGEYEKDNLRAWGLNAAALSRFINDGDAEQIASDDIVHNPEGYSSFGDIPADLLDDFIGTYYGYDLRGRNEVDDEDFSGYLNQDISKPEADYRLAPREPIYFGGYLQDKIEFEDLVLNLGVRVDVFDNNTRVLKDRFSRRPICRAGDLGTTVNGVEDFCGNAVGALPGTIGSDFSVFYAGDDVVGYRDTQGNFFDISGQEINPGDILLISQTRLTSGTITEDMFADYDPDVLFMPRVGVSFPVTDQALFFASYGITSQRPSTRSNTTLEAFQGTGGINNTNLRPEKTTSYELGFRQRLGQRSALTISGFFRQIENLIQIREIRGATPSVYTGAENVDFGTVKGVEFDFDLRRTNNIQAKVNYTLAFADGTGSSATTTSTIVWVDETPPNFISPLDFDQRHKLNAQVDYRLGPGQGPTILGQKLLENFGANVLFRAGSGFPYTPVVEPFDLSGGARAARPSGGINSARMPWNNRVDLRVDRRFYVGPAEFSAFLWVENVFNTTSTNFVWRFTGLASDDGFLGTQAGAGRVGQQVPVFQTLYQHRNNILGNVGRPRLTRLGLRFEF